MKFFRTFTQDNVKLGLVLGFFAPFIGIYGYYLFKLRATGSFWKFLNFLADKDYGHSSLTTALTFSLLANAIIFTAYANTDRYRTAKGIFILTLIYAIPLIIMKLFY
jgi:hypothetical protein